MSDYFGDSYFGKAYFGPNYFGPQQQQQAEPEQTGIEQNFVNDYRQSGVWKGNVLHLASHAEILRKRREAARIAAKRAVAKKALRSAVKRIAQSKEMAEVVAYIESLEAA